MTDSDDGVAVSSTSDFGVPIEPRVVTRTLTAAGYQITNFRRQHNHGQWICDRVDQLGARVPYLIAVFDSDEPIEAELRLATQLADRTGRVLVVVAQGPGDSWVGAEEFLERLGGAVPTWRALGAEYPDVLRISSTNITPPGLSGEGWAVFESAVADGLEFIFGRRVRRLGGTRRGLRVSDMITKTPDENILVVDAKASGAKYDVGAPNLRPLVEYVKNQRTRQRGRLEVGGALIVANSFEQAPERLRDIAAEFLADTKVPLAYLEVETLLHMITRCSAKPQSRNTLRWARLFCTVGLITASAFNTELAASDREMFPR